MISFEVFFSTLEQKNITSYKLQKDGILSNSAYQRIKNNQPMNTTTINKLCDYLHCTPDQIFTYTPPETITDPIQQNPLQNHETKKIIPENKLLKLEKQLQEIQKQINEMKQ